MKDIDDYWDGMINEHKLRLQKLFEKSNFSQFFTHVNCDQVIHLRDGRPYVKPEGTDIYLLAAGKPLHL